ncbi:hypothetical protein F5Y13DRAFT_175332 [Hypoxylon sp. FL1857]|nr:hypothetical protein F5Y13DRAFT_175332 [Hypoxylon sp. FL1857]
MMAGIRLVLHRIASSLGYVAMNVVTLPYYRFFRQNTLLPILAIAKRARLRESDTELATMLSSWRDSKLHELYIVQVAGSLLAAAVIGCFSWEPRDSEHWIGPAARYCSLVLSLLAILLSVSETSIFTAVLQKESQASRGAKFYHPARNISMVCHIVGRSLPLSAKAASAPARTSFFFTESESGGDDNREKGGGRGLQQPELGESSSPAVNSIHDDLEVHVRWNMVFTWQAPIMLLAYSIIAFFVGLTVYVCAPLYNEGLGGREAAIFYLVSLGVGGFCFVWCSFWAYKSANLDES